VIGWSASQVATALGVPDPGSGEVFQNVSTDTRTIEKGDLFVALVGERFDAHEFLSQAASRGATAAVVRRGANPVPGLLLFEVEDTLVALGQLARARRREITGPVVAVTGTNGKTSTKEMLAKALASKWSVHATHENLNNLIGVPLTILEAPAECDALVVEVGANEVGEIARMRDIVEPSIGLVTNVSHGHLQGFGSLEGVLEEKTSLLDGVPVAVVGTEPPELGRKAQQMAGRCVVAGTEVPATFTPDSWSIDENGRGTVRVCGVEVILPVLGYHQIENFLLVAAVAKELGIDLEEVGKNLSRVRLPDGRCEVIESGDRIILNDSYNANPGSLEALLKTASGLLGDRLLVFVLGTMLELGEKSAELHLKSAADVLKVNPHIVAVMGEFVPAFREFTAELGDRLIEAEDAESLGRLVSARLSGGELIVVKGSHGVRLDRAVPYLLSTEE